MSKSHKKKSGGAGTETANQKASPAEVISSDVFAELKDEHGQPIKVPAAEVPPDQMIAEPLKGEEMIADGQVHESYLEASSASGGGICIGGFEDPPGIPLKPKEEGKVWVMAPKHSKGFRRLAEEDLKAGRVKAPGRILLPDCQEIAIGSTIGTVMSPELKVMMRGGVLMAGKSRRG